MNHKSRSHKSVIWQFLAGKQDKQTFLWQNGGKENNDQQYERNFTLSSNKMITTLICKGYQIYFHEEMVGNLLARPVGNSNESNKNVTIFNL